MNRMYHFDRENCLVNLSNSILEHYHLATYHPFLKDVVEKMKPYKKIVFLLFDGMGTSLLHNNLSSHSFLREHIFSEIDSVFPPTTVAATNAFLSGRFPMETNWLGWSQYFQDTHQFLNVFSNYETYERRPSPHQNPMLDLGYYESVFDKVEKECPSVAVRQVFPSFRPGGAHSLEEWLTMIDQHLEDNEEILLYGYWENPDHLAHDYGVCSAPVKKYLEDLDDILKNFKKFHQDTLFIVLADHSLIDVTFLQIDEHSDFFNTLERPFSIEPRAASFYVKEGMEEEFELLFKKYYGQYFDLFTREEVIKKRLFGNEKSISNGYEQFIGEYLAVSIDKYCFDYCKKQFKHSNDHNMIGAHAGGIKEESKISIIIL